MLDQVNRSEILNSQFLGFFLTLAKPNRFENYKKVVEIGAIYFVSTPFKFKFAANGETGSKTYYWKYTIIPHENSKWGN